MRHLRFALLNLLLLQNYGCFQGPMDTYSPEIRLAIESGGPVARVLTYGAPTPYLGQCASAHGGELYPFMCATAENRVPGDFVLSHQTLRKLPRGRFRYYSRLTSLEVVSAVKVKGVGDTNQKTAVAKYSMVAEWSRYINVSSLDSRGSDPVLVKREGGVRAAEDVEVVAPLPILPSARKGDGDAYVFGIDYGVGVRVALDVTIRGIDAQAAASFGFGELAASIVSDGAEISVRYDTVGVREDILPPNAPTNITSVNDLVNVQRAFYGAIDEISEDWNDAYAGDTKPAGDDAGTLGKRMGGRTENRIPPMTLRPVWWRSRERSSCWSPWRTTFTARTATRKTKSKTIALARLCSTGWVGGSSPLRGSWIESENSARRARNRTRKRPTRSEMAPAGGSRGFSPTRLGGSDARARTVVLRPQRFAQSRASQVGLRGAAAHHIWQEKRRKCARV